MQIATKAFLNILLVIVNVQGTVWLRNKNERGPSAVKSGTNCLITMARNFFRNRLLTKVPIVLALQTKNLSSPSAEISVNFLETFHGLIIKEEVRKYQMRVISDSYIIDNLINVQPNAITLTDYYVLVTDDFEKLVNNVRNLMVWSLDWNPGGKFLILFNNPDIRANGANGMDVAFMFFNYFNKYFNAANVIFCYGSSALTYDIYVTHPYNNPEICESFGPFFLDSCENGILKKGENSIDYISKSHYPNKLSICTFEICARVTEPYILQDCKRGLEMEILYVLQDIMDFKIRVFCTDWPRGEKKNGNWSSLLGLIRSDRCHFVIGGFFPDNDVHEDFDVTASYLQDTYTWYVSLAPLRQPWKGLITIFAPSMWILFGIVLIISGFAWYFLALYMPEVDAHKKIILCLINTWSVFFGISANNRPEFTPLRIFFVVFALYAMTLTSIYTSKLISVFTQPMHERQIDSISKILQLGLPIGGREEYHDWFGNENDEIVDKLYSSDDEFQPSSENLLRVKYGKQAMLMNRFYVLSHHMRDEIYAVPGNVFSNPMEMIAERGFILIPKFNHIIYYMTDSGIIDKIHKDFIYNMTILENMKDQDKIQEGTQTVLTIEHLQGAFAILIFGDLISIAVFIVELITASGWFKCGMKFIRKSISRKMNKILIAFKLKEKTKKSDGTNFNDTVYRLKYKHLFNPKVGLKPMKIVQENEFLNDKDKRFQKQLHVKYYE